LENSITKGFDIKLLKGIDYGLAVRPENRPQSIAEWSEIFGLRSIVSAENYVGMTGKSINSRIDLNTEKKKNLFEIRRVLFYAFIFIAITSVFGYFYYQKLNIDSSEVTKSTQPVQIPVTPPNPPRVVKNEPTNSTAAEVLPKPPKPPINDRVVNIPNDSSAKPEKPPGSYRGKILGHVFAVNYQYNYAEVNITDPDIRVGDAVYIDWGQFRVEKISGYKCSVIPIGKNEINIVNIGMYVYKTLSN